LVCNHPAHQMSLVFTLAFDTIFLDLIQLFFLAVTYQEIDIPILYQLQTTQLSKDIFYKINHNYRVIKLIVNVFEAFFTDLYGYY